MYDATAEMVKTPDGWGKYVKYDPTTGIVTVEMDYSYLVDYNVKDCYMEVREDDRMLQDWL